MSIQITQQPSPIVLSRNPVVFQFKTDAQYKVKGKPFIGKLYTPANAPTFYNFNLAYADISLDMQVTENPDDSGYQIRSRWAGATDQQYFESLIADLSGNFYLNRDFTFSIDTDNFGPFVKVAARKNGYVYNLSLTPVVYMGLSYKQAGENDVPNPNFKLYCELWVAPANGGEPVNSGTAYLEPDANGMASLDLSLQITDAMLANGFERPDFSNPIAQVNNRSVCRYYLRYAEVYGDTQVIRRIQQTGNYIAMLGGISKEMLATFAFPGNFIAGPLLKFIKQEPAEKSLLPEQAEFLTAVLFTGAIAGLKLKFELFYEDGTTATVIKHEVGDRPQYTKVTFPVGYVQNNLNLVNAEKATIKYTVQMVDGANNPVSEIRTYWLDYELYPYQRQFIYLSSLGTYDSLLTFGKGSTQYGLTLQTAEISTDKGFVLADGEQITFANSLSNTESVASGYRSKSEIRLFKDLVLSLDLLLYRKKRTYAVALASNNIKEFKDGAGLHAITFDFGYRYSEQLFTVDDMDDQDTPMFLPMSFNSDQVEAPLPDNSFDYRYYLKSETLTTAEIQALVAAVQSNLNDLNDQELQDVQELLLKIADKADAIHEHDERYIPREEMNDLIIAIQDVLENGAGIRPEDIGAGLIMEEDILKADFTAIPSRAEFLAVKNALIPHPTYNAPVASLSPGSQTGEVGESRTVTLIVSYVQRDAGVANGYQVLKAGNVVSIGNSFTDTVVLAPAAISYTGAVSYNAGPVKKNVLGEDDATGQIPAGTIGAGPTSLTGYYASWYGYADAVPADSAAVRGLMTLNASNQPVSGKLLTNAGNSFTHRTGTAKIIHVIVLAPTKTLSSVVDQDALNKDITNEYVYQGTITVNDAAGVPVPGFKLYVKTMGVAYTSSHRHLITTV